MGLYRRGKIYWYSIKHNGKRIQDSTGTANRKLAERIFAKVQTDIEEGRWFENQIKKKPFKEMIDRYENEYTESKDYYQKRRDRSIFKHLKSFFGEHATLEDIENQIGGYEHYRRSQGRKPGTIMKELSLLRRIFNIARKQWKWKIQNPVCDIELPKVRNERVRYLSEKEYKELFKALDHAPEKWLKPFVTIALDTGLRLSNLCELSLTEVNLAHRMIIINAEKMKNDDYIGIPLTERACNTLRELQKIKCISGHVFHDSGQKLYYVKVQRAFANVLKRAKISDFRFHDLRHTFASYLTQRGIDLHTIATLVGHKDLRMTKRYAHLDVESLRNAISRLDRATILLQSEGQKGAQAL